MLLSQRIAKDVSFLHSILPKHHTLDLFSLRLKIIKATKVIVPQDLLDSRLSYGDSIRKIVPTGTPAEIKKKIEQYEKYSRLPFESMFIENHTSGLLVESSKDGGYAVTSVDANGGVSPCITFCNGFVEVSGTMQPKTRYRLAVGDFPPTVETSEIMGQLKDMAIIEATFHTFIIHEVMLFLNVKNVTLHHYVPSKKENSMIPKPLLSHYTYRILDVFREVTQYESLGQVIDQLQSTSNQVVGRRAHLVRGHFKQLKTGLFWWSDFTRCRHNRDKVGVVEKDYRINT